MDQNNAKNLFLRFYSEEDRNHELCSCQFLTMQGGR